MRTRTPAWTPTSSSATSGRFRDRGSCRPTCSSPVRKRGTRTPPVASRVTASATTAASIRMPDQRTHASSRGRLSQRPRDRAAEPVRRHRHRQVKVGTPHINVSQNPNGSMRVEYKAVDPFSPGGEEIASRRRRGPSTANSSSNRPQMGPSPVESCRFSRHRDLPPWRLWDHRDRKDHAGEHQSIRSARRLPFSQNIGTPMMGEFPDTVILPPAGVPNLSLPTRARAPSARRRAHTVVVIPYPRVDLGPVGDEVNVPVGGER